MDDALTGAPQSSITSKENIMSKITIHVDGMCEPHPGGVGYYAWSAQDATGAESASAHGHLVSGPEATNTRQSSAR
jgi:ribonuclease HI